MTPKQSTPWFASKTVLKILSFFFGVSLWFYVLNSDPIEVEKSVAVEFLTPAGFALKSLPPSDLKIKLKGSRTFVDHLFVQDEKVSIELTKEEVNQRNGTQVKFSEQNIPLPFGVEIVEVDPPLVKLEFDKQISRDIPVKINFTGSLPSELRMIKSSLDRKEFRVKGPRFLVSGLKSVLTAPVNLNALRGTGTKKLALLDLDPRLVIEQESAVELNFEIKARQANTTLKNVKIFFLSSDNQFKPERRKVTLDVLVPEDGNVQLTESTVKVIAVLDRGSEKVQTVNLKAELPDGVHLVKINPSQIKVTWEGEKAEK